MEGWPQQLSGDFTVCRVPYVGSSEQLNRMGAGGEREKKKLNFYFDSFVITPFLGLWEDSLVWLVHFWMSVMWELAGSTLAVLPQ